MSKKIFFNDKYGLTQAVLDGRKTMTRRIATYEDIKELQTGLLIEGKNKGKRILCSGLLLVATSSYTKDEVIAIAQAYKTADVWDSDPIFFDGMRKEAGWSNKLFVCSEYMPHHIKITDIKVERLQDISDEDCLREGVYMRTEQHPRQEFEPEYTFGEGKYHAQNPIAAFAALTDKVSGKGTWAANPFCFCYTFELID